jgi:murein DD-endopeptidase MepM/ murein hydrolase activator NlpD
MFTPLFSPKPAEAESVDLWPHEIKDLEQKRLKELIKKRKSEEAGKTGLDFLHKADETRIKENEQKVKLQEMANKVASQPGYQDFMTMPLMSKMVKNVISDDTQPTKKTGKLEADPSFTKISSNSKQKDIKRKESQADVMAKMFNLMQEQYDYKENRNIEIIKYQKKLNVQKEKFFLETLNVLGGTNNATGKSLKPGKMARVAKTSKAEGSGALTFGLKTAAVVGSLFVAQNALANIDWKKEFSSITDVNMEDFNLNSLSSKIQGMLDTSSLQGSDGSEGDLDPRKEVENYIGRAISDTEMHHLIKATHAEAGIKSDKKEQAMIAATILNRARESGKTITETLEAPNQFQSVTGTSKNRAPSAQFIVGPSDSRKETILNSLQSISGVDKNQTNFASADPNAYKEGTSADQKWMKEGKTALNYTQGGSKFNTKPPEDNVPRPSTMRNNSNDNRHMPMPLDADNVSSDFGLRKDPFTGLQSDHKGIDIKGKLGDQVLAVKAGKVEYAGELGNYGKIVIIDHGNGEKTKYAHLDKIDVAKGDMVEAKQLIGKVGSTGRSTGTHLHFELVQDGVQKNPKIYGDPVVRNIPQLANFNKKGFSGSNAVVEASTVNNVNQNQVWNSKSLSSNETLPIALQKQFGYIN